MMAAGHPHCYVATASVGLPDRLDEQGPQRTQPQGRRVLDDLHAAARRASSTRRRARSISGRLVVECGLYPIWEWNPKRASTITASARAACAGIGVLKLQGRFGHLHAEHIAKLQNFANQQWRMMGVALPEPYPRCGRKKSGQYVECDSGRGRGGDPMNTKQPLLLPLPKRRKAMSLAKAKSAGRHAKYARKRRSIATTPCCACTPATRFSPTTGTRMKC